MNLKKYNNFWRDGSILGLSLLGNREPGSNMYVHNHMQKELGMLSILRFKMAKAGLGDTCHTWNYLKYFPPVALAYNTFTEPEDVQ